LREGRVGNAELQAVERRRRLPTRLIQRLQVIIQNRIIGRVLGSDRPVTAPLPLRLFQRLPWLRRLPARIVGIGFRPEHVRVTETGLGGHE